MPKGKPGPWLNTEVSTGPLTEDITSTPSDNRLRQMKLQNTLNVPLEFLQASRPCGAPPRRLFVCSPWVTTPGLLQASINARKLWQPRSSALNNASSGGTHRGTQQSGATIMDDLVAMDFLDHSHSSRTYASSHV